MQPERDEASDEEAVRVLAAELLAAAGPAELLASLRRCPAASPVGWEALDVMGELDRALLVEVIGVCLIELGLWDAEAAAAGRITALAQAARGPHRA